MLFLTNCSNCEDTLTTEFAYKVREKYYCDKMCFRQSLGYENKIVHAKEIHKPSVVKPLYLLEKDGPCTCTICARSGQQSNQQHEQVDLREKLADLQC